MTACTGRHALALSIAEWRIATTGSPVGMVQSFLRLVVGLIAGVIIVASSSRAQDGAPSSLLTPEIVEHFIASFPEVKAKVDDLRAQYDVPGNLSGAATWRAWADVNEAKRQLDAVVQDYGFPDFPSWVRTFSVTAQTYAFTQSGTDLDRKMAEALARIENEPNVPEAQKEMMRQQLRHSADAIAAIKPSQGNIDAVTPYAAELEQLFEEE